MSDLLLHENEQAAVRSILAIDQLRGIGLPGSCAVELVGRLIPSDASGVALLDTTGSVVDLHDLGLRALPRAVPPSVVPRIGVHRRDRAVEETGARTGVAVLSLGVRNGGRQVVTLWLVRRDRDFSPRDHAMLVLVAPALERLMREPVSAYTLPSLTLQEQRVLRLVASGRSNGEIAEHLCVAPCTVRKHLEHAYRKLGVTNRLAAVLALEGASQD